MRLKTSHGTYVVMGPDGELLHLPDPRAQKFRSAWDVAQSPSTKAGLTKAAVTEGPLAPSTMEVLADGVVAFRRDGLYLCADPGLSEVRFDRSHAAEWERFTIQPGDGTVVGRQPAESLAQPPNLIKPLLIETLAGYQIMGEGANADLVTVTWPELFEEPINRHTMPDGCWIVDVDQGPEPDVPFLVYWFYPFKADIHVWRLDSSGKRISGYDLVGEPARTFLLARRALGPAFITRFYMLLQKAGDWEAVASLSADIGAAAEAGSVDALYAVLRRPFSFPPATVRSLAARAFHYVRAINLARAEERERHIKRLTVEVLSEALSHLDPALGGPNGDRLQYEVDFSQSLADPKHLPEANYALPFTLHRHTQEGLASTLDGSVTILTLGVVLLPKKRAVEFHYIQFEGGLRRRVFDGIKYAYYALSTNQAAVWEALAKRDTSARVWNIRFEVGDMTTTAEPSAAFERYVGDTRFALVPDAYYFESKGFRRGWFHGDIPPWSEKATKFLWRGSTTGAWQLTGETLAQAARFRLCELGRDIGPVADFGFTAVVQARSEADSEEIKIYLRDQGFWREHMAQHVLAGAKFLVEIDGNANSWGFFAKLLMGCCVLKVDSPYEQWFYDRLEAWVHYVPVAHDLSDLSDKVHWCLQNENACREIADAGYRFAVSLGFDKEMASAADTFVAVARRAE